MISATEEVLVLRVKDTLSNLRTYANGRRKASRIDAVADAIDFCVGEVEEALVKSSDETKLLTTQQYARSLPLPVSVQTVRKWVRLGRLEAVETPRGYLIPRDAVVRT